MSSFTSSSGNWIYDVFMSFNGEGTRTSFTSNLCSSLQNAGFFVLKTDDEALTLENPISTNKTLQAIESSRISVIVFSQDYANSRWCLQELVKIMECHRNVGQVVRPVFYEVDPSDVRHQKGIFGENFENLMRRISMEKEEVLSYRTALCEAANFSGFAVMDSRNETEDIKNVVEDVTRFLDRAELFVANHPVGMKSRVQDVIQLLNNQQSKDVVLLGIWGMGGIGKTTIAKAIYNQIGRCFEGRSFLLNIREVWEQVNGQVYLQEQLLSDIFKTTKTKIDSIKSGEIILKNRLSRKRVLIVLDDVNDSEQLNALSGSRDWFGPGSRIIITTRDMHLLKVLRIDHVYRVKEMDEMESIELLSWHAFKKAIPTEDFVELSREIVAYCGGLPLALQVLGSYLFDRSTSEWRSILAKLKRIPNRELQMRLRMSFDGLHENEKVIFLDIACFFVGMNRNDVIHILNGCGLFGDNGILVLLERGLVTIDHNNRLGMHDLLRHMGREIVREESLIEPAKRSRLWFQQEVIDVLSENIGTSAIKGLSLKLPRSSKISLSTRAFKRIKKLKFLQLAGVELSGEFKYLSRNLTWLCWQGFPLKYIPADLYQQSLVAIELEYSNLKAVWKKAQLLEKLKILNLSHSRYLTQSPNFSYLPNLEELILEDCPCLSAVSNTIGDLNKLILINLKDCISLRALPRSIYKLKSLKTLILSGCSTIDKLEEDIEQMESLTTLIADQTAITQVPFSVVNSKSIGFISFSGNKGLSRDVFPSIIWSWMSPTNSLPPLLQTSAGLSSLVSINLPNTSLYGLSYIFEDLAKLRRLQVECGSEYQVTEDLSTILDILYATKFKELETMATTSQVSNAETSALINCRSQVHISGSKNSLNSVLIQMGPNCQVTNVLKESILQKLTTLGPDDCLLPRDNFPDWLAFHGEGPSVILEVPRVNGRNLKRMMMWVVYSSSADNITLKGLKNILIINYTKTTIQVFKRDILTSFQGVEWQSVTSNLESGNKVEVCVVFGNESVVKKTTIYLIYEDEETEEKLEHLEEEMVQIWGRELFESSGVFTNSRNESEDIGNVDENVTDLLHNEDLGFARNPMVGVQSRVQYVLQELNNQSKDVLLLGIWGMGGMGKTTIAKALYDEVSPNFGGRSFLPNIREVWENATSKVYLHERLLNDICDTTEIKIDSIESGNSILKERLHNKKVLVVLDDVNKLDQLNALIENREWFGPGSLIVITTRDKHLLDVVQVNHVYRMEEMNNSESFELFSWYAFRQASPKEEFVELTKKVVAYCGGLPLALVVLGSELNERAITYWEKVLHGLASHPHPLVHQILKISFEDLQDANEKDIFLDIACFYIGVDQNDAIKILNSYGLEAKTGISVLMEQSLVTVDERNKLGMHVLLRDMGREIIREGSPKMPMPGIFDAFLSFRGKDTRALFTSHLDNALKVAGISVFKDDDALARGERVSISLLQAIERSRISVIVLSRNYANSEWCMLELERIMERQKTRSHMVLPVFYGVKPSDVRDQTGEFGEAFEVLLSKISIEADQIQRWRRALFIAGDLSGIEIIDTKDESQDIRKVVDHVTRLLDRKEVFVANHPVGVKSCVQDLIQQLPTQASKDVLLLGIWGMGGIGKTTIAKALYNEINSKFDGRSCLLNIREDWENYPNRAHLQERLLSDIYKTMTIKIRNIEAGKVVLEGKLPHVKVLVLLDDVNNEDQLKALFGSREWFCPGSMIIITTRDEHLLRVVEVDHVYRMKAMDKCESVELFSWHAFKQEIPKVEFAEITGNVVDYCGGLPLALEVLGTHLSDKGKSYWKKVLEKLKIIPNHKVIEKLKISYDGLSDDTVKRVFLDISFFFIGMDKNDVLHILSDSGLFPDDGINILVDRCLLTVDCNNKLEMHGLLRDMGREIVRQESPIVPEERSRLWVEEEVIKVLSNHTGTKAVEGLSLQFPGDSNVALETKAFKKMKKLRLLQLDGVKLDGDFQFLSRDLRWLCWHRFPETCIPKHLHQQSLTAIELEYSNLKLAWEIAENGQIQQLKKLKILNLSHSHELTQTPDFSYLPNLEKLVLKDCPRLSAISDTIGNLNKILVINLEDCTNLCNLPGSFYQLTSLETLILSGCSKIDKLEDDIEQMVSLTVLIVDNTAITQVPKTIVRLKGFRIISVCGYKGSFCDVPRSLISSLNATDLPKFRSLQVKSISELTKELEAMPSTSQVSNVKASAVIDCCGEVHISFKSLLIQMGMNCPVTNILKEHLLQKLKIVGPGDCILPGDNDPNWRTFNGEGSSVSFNVPQVTGRKLKRMTLCIVCSSSPNITTSEGLKNVFIINDTKNTSQVFRRDELTSFEVKWEGVISNLEPGDKVEVCVAFGKGFIVERTTIYLIYDEPIDEKIDQSHAQDKSGDENRSPGGIFTLPSLLHAIMSSPPFWVGLAAIMVWSRHRPNKRRRD